MIVGLHFCVFDYFGIKCLKNYNRLEIAGTGTVAIPNIKEGV